MFEDNKIIGSLKKALFILFEIIFNSFEKALELGDFVRRKVFIEGGN